MSLDTDMVELRGYVPGDAGTVAALLRDAERSDAAVDGPDDAAFEAFSSIDVNREGRDFRLLLCGGELAGVLLSARYEVQDRPRSLRGFRIFVAPRFRRRGFAKALFDEACRQDSRADVILRTMVRGDNGFVHDLLKQHGFSDVQRVLHLRYEGPPPPIPTVAHTYGVRLAQTEADLDRVTRLQNEANLRSFGFVPMSRQDFTAFLGVTEGRLFLLEDELGQLIGSVHTLPYYGGVGLLHAISIKPGHQGRGLGRYLTAYGMNSLAQQGFRRIDLTVDETNKVAVRLYRGLNFLQFRRDVTYER